MRSLDLTVPEILVTRVEFGARDPDTLPDAVVRFCNWCLEEARLVRENVQPDAWLIYHSSFYIGQVKNGGHGQFASNSEMEPGVLNDIEAGLDRLELKNLLAIFQRFRNRLGSDPDLARVVIDGAGFGDIPDAISELDDAFHDSSDLDCFSRQATNWLRQASTVIALTPRELRERQKAIMAGNALPDRQRTTGTSQSPWMRLTNFAARLLEKAAAQRPDETIFDQKLRSIAADRPREWQISDIQGGLIQEVYPAVADGDHERIDRIFAGFRDLHAHYRISSTDRWPDTIRMYASKLLYAGERLARPDLLEQAADAFGQTIATGAIYKYDAGFDWRSLGQSLVQLGRLCENRLPGVREAVDAFINALAADASQLDLYGCRVRSILGRAEAHLVLAANGGSAEQLDAARDALVEARPLLRPDDRNHWGVVNAELLSLLPPAKVPARERASAVRQLGIAITWETENDGGDQANPLRLQRLRRLLILLEREQSGIVNA
ncbi:DMP19 family protein [Sphingopyxis sp. R3-92]|uniref:DMP19 family protein n=1 Tax=Sphingopyxis sp. R3-92 TaxID=3158553 RepID=UPI003EE4A8A7